ncbi:MAG: SDR family NAD(P)-dependent oxidoreductase [Myxococcota bacterium]
MSFHGRLLAITGAASGIGRALALELAARGADLALSDIDEAGLAETKTRVAKRGRTASTTRVDVANKDEMFSWARSLLESNGRVDGIVNNAGVGVTRSFAEMSYDDIEWILGINLWGVIHGTKAFLPGLLRQDDGWINIFSQDTPLTGLAVP